MDLHSSVLFAAQAVIAQAVAALPLLKTPGVHWAFRWVVFWVASRLAEVFQEWLAVQVIEARTDAEKKAYDKAKEELRAVLASYPDPKEAKRASEDFDRRLAALVRLRP